MKLFIIVVVSMIVITNGQDEPLKVAVQLLEAILNDTRELQYQLLENILNETRAIKKLQENTLNKLVDKVDSVVARLENIGQEADDYHRLSQQWYTQPNVFVSFASCEDIKTMSPSAPSGYYNITKYDGTTQRVYCDMKHSHLSCSGIEHSLDCMTEHCGSTGWTRVAYLNMSNPLQQCPSNLRLYNHGGVRACGRRTSSNAGCNSVTFSTTGISYSQVCGRVIGYQYGAPDAFYPGGDHVLINSPYVEGISITKSR